MYSASSSSQQRPISNGRGPPLSIDVQGANSRLRTSPPQQQQYQSAEEEAQAILMMEDEDASDGEHGARGGRRREQNGNGHDGIEHEPEHEHEHEHEDDDLNDDSGSFSDSLSSSPSIPDDDIDFDFVYAFHTFLATVDGQASVVKGDKLMLLDDTNSYWWLIRVLKTQAVGYIPAENIETPQERLARLNKHRNVDLTSIIPADYETGPSSTLAQTRFGGRIPPSRQPHPHKSQHPSAKGFPASPSHKDHPRNISDERPERSHSSKAKTVIFTAPIYYEHSANGSIGEDQDEEDYGGDEMDDEGDEYEEEDGEEGDRDEEEEVILDENGNRVRVISGRRRSQHQMQGEQVFDHDESGTESEFSEDEDHQMVDHQRKMAAGDEGEVVQNVAGGGNGGGRRGVVHHHPQSAATASTAGVVGYESGSGPRVAGGDADAEDERRWRLQQEQQLREQQYEYDQNQQQIALQNQQRQLYEFQQQQQQQPHQHQQQLLQQQQQQQSLLSSTPPRASSSSTRRPSTEFDPDAPTKKLSATPDIIRDPTFDINNPFGDQGGLPRPSSPLRVRGVEVVDPRDPRYQKLISDRKPGDNLLERSGGARSIGTGEDTNISIDEGSFISNPSEEGHGSVKSLGSIGGGGIGAGLSPGKKLRKPDATGGISSVSPVVTVVANEEKDKEKKRKSGGGILSGLFGRKKDKKRKNSEEGLETGSIRGSEDSARRSESTPTPTTASQQQQERALSPPLAVMSSASPGVGVGTGIDVVKRESQTAESMFSTDAALRQQELEAKQAMYHQYGVHRGPSDVTNQMAPRNPSMQGQNLSPTTGFSPSMGPNSSGGQRMRPGSLIGSPSIPGLDVPLLSVLRVFAGDNIESEATFKTVLLNRSTTSADLVKQSMQRFRLAGLEDRDEYFLTVKELGGDERPLFDDQKPLVIFEALSDIAGDGSGFAIPSVKRSSIGSINSISSNLSLNPAITRLGMNDFSDDSAVKFYLNRRPPPSTADSSMSLQSDTDSVITATGPSGLTLEQSAVAGSPSFRFAVRILIHPEDLPDDIVFDPHSHAIIPRPVLAERQARAGNVDMLQDAVSPNSREKIVFFPRNVNVSEVIEAGVDRFGIVDAIVDGGDEVEDRLSRRRSTVRAKYGLTALKNGQETPLSSSGKLLDAYSSPPLFKAYDRTSKEFRRRSVDATLILGASHDVQPSDPVFILRRAPTRGSGSTFRNSISSPMISAETSPTQVTHPVMRRQERPNLDVRQLAEGGAVRSSTASSTESVYQTPIDEKTQELLARAASPQATKQEIIAAQRAVSRANQNAILSAQSNSEQGVDIVVPDRGTIRSSRNIASDRVRYSYIDPDGTETDISEIVESEWATDKTIVPGAGAGVRSFSSLSRGTTATTDSFHSTAESPTSSIDPGRPSTSADEDDEEERQAINVLRSTPVTIDRELTAVPPLKSAPSSSSLSSRHRTEGGDVLQDALVGARPSNSPLLNESLQDRLDRVLAKVRESKANGRSSPQVRPRPGAFLNGRASPNVGGSGRTSPLVAPTERKVQTGRKSPLNGTGGRDSPSIEQIIGRHGHGKKPSITSMSSTHSSGTTNTDQPSTPVTGGSNGNSFTPISSVNSSHRPPVYRDDFGLETLMAIVEADSLSKTISHPPLVGAETLFGRALDLSGIQPEIHSWYQGHSKTLDDLDTRLDALLLQVITV